MRDGVPTVDDALSWAVYAQQPGAELDPACASVLAAEVDRLRKVEIAARAVLDGMRGGGMTEVGIEWTLSAVLDGEDT